jgi:FkbM family methyltransferase
MHSAEEREVLLDRIARDTCAKGPADAAPEWGVFCDIGAHIGFTSLIASRLVGPSGRVEAFEPSPSNRQRLVRSIELNGSSNVAVHREAIAGQAGTRPFRLHEMSPMSGLVDGRDDSTIEISCTTLDHLGQRLPSPDLIKIDTEGSELEVLRGGQQLLATTRPRLIIEFTNPQLVRAARQLLPHYAAACLDQNHWMFRPERLVAACPVD